MTRYPAWKKEAINRKWRGLLAIFICVVLFFAAVNGVVKSFSIKNLIARSNWETQSSFVAAVGAKSPGLFVYMTEPKKILLFKFNSEVHMITGKTDDPLAKVSDVIAKGDGAVLDRIMSLATGVKVDKFITIGEELDKQTLEKNFKNFASIVTPFRILTRGVGSSDGSTNITRLDAIKLWWQLKGLGVDKLNLVDLSTHNEEVLTDSGNKVLGVDEAELNFEISKYVKNNEILVKNVAVNIENRSDRKQALDLAISFSSGAGYNVGRIENAESDLAETVIQASDPGSYEAKYLARIFDCDKISALKGDQGNILNVIIGRNFSRKYFE